VRQARAAPAAGVRGRGSALRGRSGRCRRRRGLLQDFRHLMEIARRLAQVRAGRQLVATEVQPVSAVGRRIAVEIARREGRDHRGFVRVTR